MSIIPNRFIILDPMGVTPPVEVGPIPPHKNIFRKIRREFQREQEQLTLFGPRAVACEQEGNGHS